MLSYCCWSSHAFFLSNWMLGSSYNIMRTSSTQSNMVVHSCTVPPISSSPAAITLVCYSLTSRGVEDFAFNHNLEIWRFSSSCTFVVSSLASQTPLARLWVHTSIGRSATILSSGTRQQASSTIYTNCLFYNTNSSCYKLSFSILSSARSEPGSHGSPWREALLLFHPIADRAFLREGQLD